MNAKSETNKRRRDIDRAILKLAIPAIVNNVTVPLLGLSDTAISGHLGSASYLGAIAVGSMMLNVIYWVCGFLRMSTSGLTAQAYGASDVSGMLAILKKSLGIAAILSIVAIALQKPLLWLLTLIISPDPGVAALASSYFLLCIWAAPAQLGMMVLSGWFIGRQNTVVPMFVSVGVNVLNILLSVLLVFVFHVGFTGIAVGTAVSAYFGLIAIAITAAVNIRREKAPTHTSGSPVRYSLSGVNIQLFLRSACIMAVSLGMTSVGARLGSTTLAANAVVMQYFLFFSYFMDGFAFAGEALVGKSLGARDYEALRADVRGLLRWGVYMALLFLAVYILCLPAITDLLTDVAEVRSSVRELSLWVVLLPPITVAAFIFDGVFIGLARTRPLLVTTLLAASVFFIGAFAGGLPPNWLLWTAFEAYLLLRGVLLAAVYSKIQMN